MKMRGALIEREDTVPWTVFWRRDLGGVVDVERMYAEVLEIERDVISELCDYF